MDRREFIKRTGLSSLAVLASNYFPEKSFAEVNVVVENTKNSDLSRVRFGIGENEVITFCKAGGDSSLCVGIECNTYQSCWKNLNPDKEGYFESKVTSYYSS